MKKYFFAFLSLSISVSITALAEEATNEDFSRIESLVEKPVLTAEEIAQQNALGQLNKALTLLKVSDHCLMGQKDVSESCRQEREQAIKKLLTAADLGKAIRQMENRTYGTIDLNAKLARVEAHIKGSRLLGVNEKCLTTKTAQTIGFADQSAECVQARQTALRALRQYDQIADKLFDAGLFY